MGIAFVACVLSLLLCCPVFAQEADLGLCVSSLELVNDAFTANEWKCPVDSGALVHCVAAGSPLAGKVSVMAVVVSIDQTPVNTSVDYIRAVGALKPGSVVNVGLYNAAMRVKPKWTKTSIRVTVPKSQELFAKSFRTTVDDVQDMNIHRPIDAPVSSRSKFVSAYLISKKDGNPTLRLKVSWVGRDWLFINKVIFRVNDGTVEFPISIQDRQSDNDGRSVWEWTDKALSENEIEQLESVVQSLNSKVRLEGDQYKDDWPLSVQELRGLYAAIAAYRYLKN